MGFSYGRDKSVQMHNHIAGSMMMLCLNFLKCAFNAKNKVVSKLFLARKRSEIPLVCNTVEGSCKVKNKFVIVCESF